jgi:hypothetical protein
MRSAALRCAICLSLGSAVFAQCPSSAAGAFTAQMLNVKCFGALGDGVTDDWPAFARANSAIRRATSPARAYAAAIGGIYIPEGIYFLSRPIPMTNYHAASDAILLGNARTDAIDWQTGFGGRYVINGVKFKSFRYAVNAGARTSTSADLALIACDFYDVHYVIASHGEANLVVRLVGGKIVLSNMFTGIDDSSAGTVFVDGATVETISTAGWTGGWIQGASLAYLRDVSGSAGAPDMNSTIDRSWIKVTGQDSTAIVETSRLGGENLGMPGIRAEAPALIGVYNSQIVTTRQPAVILSAAPIAYDVRNTTMSLGSGLDVGSTYVSDRALSEFRRAATSSYLGRDIFFGLGRNFSHVALPDQVSGTPNSGIHEMAMLNKMAPAVTVTHKGNIVSDVVFNVQQGAPAVSAAADNMSGYLAGQKTTTVSTSASNAFFEVRTGTFPTISMDAEFSTSFYYKTSGCENCTFRMLAAKLLPGVPLLNDTYGQWVLISLPFYYDSTSTVYRGSVTGVLRTTSAKLYIAGVRVDIGLYANGNRPLTNEPGYVPACETYALSNNGSNWTVDGVPGRPVPPAAKGNVVLFALAGKGVVDSVEVKTTAAWAGSGFNSIGLTIGGSIAGDRFYMAVPYELTNAASDTNFASSGPLGAKHGTYAGENVVAALTANQPLNAARMTGAVDISVCRAVLP